MSRCLLASLLLTAVATLAAGPAAATLECNGAPVAFEGGLPAGWTTSSELGTLSWGDRSGCGESFNYTGGGGDSACVSSDLAGPGAFDAVLATPALDLSTAGSALLRYRVNYQSFAGSDALALEASVDAGVSWAAVAAGSADLGGMRALPGEAAEVDLTAFAGAADVRLRWRYADPDPEAFGWYAQVDDVRLLCDAAPACSVAPITDRVQDGGFETGSPSGAWTEGSTLFGSPICTAATCGFGGARSGDGWAFLGGSDTGSEVSSVEQSMVFDAGIASLSFSLWIPRASGNGADVLNVLVDGQPVRTVNADEITYRAGYRRVEVNLSAFADGLSHTVRIEAVTGGAPAHSNFFVDDVALEICTAVSGSPALGVADVELVEGDAGTVEALFLVELSHATTATVTVDFATSDGSATAGSDYTAAAGTLTFAPGETVREVAVVVSGETAIEDDETFFLDLSAAANATIERSQASATILDDDTPPTLSVGDVVVTESDLGSVDAVFVVTLSEPSLDPISVAFATTDGTATAGSDYLAASGVLDFEPGVVAKTLVVQVVGDSASEPPETFRVVLLSPVGAVLADGEGEGTILNNDDPPVLFVADAVVAEGDQGTVQGAVELSLAFASHLPVSVDYATVAGSATAPEDFVAAAGTLIIPAGSVSAVLAIAVEGDVLEEGDESFEVSFSNVVNASLDRSEAAVVVRDDDLPGGACYGGDLVTSGSFEATTLPADWTVASGSWSTTTSPPFGAVAGSWVARTAGAGDAEIFQDLDLSAYAQAIDAGGQALELAGWVVSASTAPADSTRVILEYRDAANAAVLGAFDSGEIASTAAWQEVTERGIAPVGTRWARLRLVSRHLEGGSNDTYYDGFVLRPGKRAGLSGDGVRVVEGDGVPVDAVFTLNLTCAFADDVTVNYATTDGTAAAGVDYTASAGSVLFPAGSVSEQVTVPVLADVETEIDESFTVDLTGTAEMVVATPVLTGTIVDRSAPVLTVADVTVAEGDAGTTMAVFAASLDTTFPFDVAADYATRDGSALASGSDYVATAGTLTIPAGSAAGTIQVEIVGDGIAEGDEFFDLELFDPHNVTLGTLAARGTIQNDDALVRVVAGEVAVAEGNVGSTIAQLPVTLTGPAALPVVVDYEVLTNGSAYAGLDFVAAEGRVSIPAGASSTTIPVEVLGDGLPEGDEAIAVRIVAVTNAVVYPAEAIGFVTVVEDDAACVGANLFENGGGEERENFGAQNLIGWTEVLGNWGQRTGNSPLPVEGGVSILTIGGAVAHELAQDVDVSALSADIDAGAVSFFFEGFVRALEDDASRIVLEYRDGSGTVLDSFDSSDSVNPFAWEQVVDIRSAPAGTEVLRVRLVSAVPIGAFHSALYDALTLRAVGTSTVSAGEVAVFEENAVANVPVKLSCASTSTVSVGYATADGTAVAPSDYTAVSGTVTFAPGETFQEIAVPVVDDTSYEPAQEEFYLDLAGPVGTSIGLARGRVVVLADGEEALLDIAPARVVEGDVGTRNLFFTVYLDRPASVDVTADFATAPLGNEPLDFATAGVDYVATTGTLTIPAGALTADVAVQILGDLEDEEAEGFRLNVNNAIGAGFRNGFGGDFAAATIEDDDGDVTVSIANASRREFDRGLHDLDFVVSLSKPVVYSDVAVDFWTGDLTALAGFDYVARSGQIVIPAGQTEGTITIQTIGDELWDGDPVGSSWSQFTVDIAPVSPLAVIGGDTQALGSLFEDDRFIRRYATTTRGGVVLTGNTLGLARGTDTEPGPKARSVSSPRPIPLNRWERTLRERLRTGRRTRRLLSWICPREQAFSTPSWCGPDRRSRPIRAATRRCA